MVVHAVIPALGRQKEKPYQPWMHGEPLSETAGHEKPGCQVSEDERRRKCRGPVPEGSLNSGSTGKGPGSLPEFVALTWPLWRRWMASFLWAGERVGGEEAEVLVSESKRKEGLFSSDCRS